MQTLYSLLQTDVDLHNQTANAKQKLIKKFEDTHKLYTYLLDTAVKVTAYAKKDALKKAGKHLPTKDDLSVNTKIANNVVSHALLNNPSFEAVKKKFQLEHIDDESFIVKAYTDLKNGPVYKEYINEKQHNTFTDKEIFKYVLFDVLLSDEAFQAFLEEHFMNWSDDMDNIAVLLTNFIQKPERQNFAGILSPEKHQYAETLLQTVIEKKPQLTEIITPKLKNWDAERIAVLDMILLQMGVAEFLFFDTIPTKVTLNEFIDIAKEYSTQQSGQFVNGILDTIHKELVNTKQIHKKSHKSLT